jgi:hypothetical protein
MGKDVATLSGRISGETSDGAEGARLKSHKLSGKRTEFSLHTLYGMDMEVSSVTNLTF